MISWVGSVNSDCPIGPPGARPQDKPGFRTKLGDAQQRAHSLTMRVTQEEPMARKCGHCKEWHLTSLEGRACAQEYHSRRRSPSDTPGNAKPSEETLDHVEQPGAQDPPDQSVVEALSSWRRERARSLRKPAYTVLTNNAIEGLIDMWPTTLDDLLYVNGIGPITIELYGEELLRILAAHERYASLTPQPDPRAQVPDGAEALSPSIQQTPAGYRGDNTFECTACHNNYPIEHFQFRFNRSTRVARRCEACRRSNTVSPHVDLPDWNDAELNQALDEYFARYVSNTLSEPEDFDWFVRLGDPDHYLFDQWAEERQSGGNYDDEEPEELGRPEPL